MLRAAEGEKKKKYMAACEARHILFTPICCSVDGIFNSEAEVFLKRASENLSSKWRKSYSEIMGWVRTRMSFAILRSSILCLRGSHTKWRLKMEHQLAYQ